MQNKYNYIYTHILYRFREIHQLNLAKNDIPAYNQGTKIQETAALSLFDYKTLLDTIKCGGTVSPHPPCGGWNQMWR